MEVPQPPKTSYRPSLQLLSHYYSVKSTLRYEPERKLVTAVAAQSRQNVFDRLYLRESLRPRESARSADRPSDKPTPRRSRGPGIPPVEEQLLSKGKAALEHITSLRTKFLVEELTELRPAPAINPMSRKIVERLDRERYGVHPPPLVVAAHVPASDPPPTQAEGKPQARVPQLGIPQGKGATPKNLSKSETNMLRAMMLHGKITSTPRRAGQGVDTRQNGDGDVEEAIKIATLQSLRNEVMTRFHSEEPELPPDFFSLSFDARSRVFSENRNRKLQQAKQKEQAKVAQECTFEPIFYARIPLRRLNRTTSELLHLSQERSPVPRQEPTLTQRIRRSPGYYERYQHRLTDTLRQSTSPRDCYRR